MFKSDVQLEWEEEKRQERLEAEARIERYNALCKSWHVRPTKNPEEKRIQNMVRVARRRSRMRSCTPEWVNDILRDMIEDVYSLARMLDLHVDHDIPVAGCKDCGAFGLHVPANLRLVTAFENIRKGARCSECSAWRASKIRTRDASIFGNETQNLSGFVGQQTGLGVTNSRTLCRSTKPTSRWWSAEKSNHRNGKSPGFSGLLALSIDVGRREQRQN